MFRNILSLIFLYIFWNSIIAQDYSLRFLGTNNNNQGPPDVDRVKILLDAPHKPVDIGVTDFTVEFWMKANPGENIAGSCSPNEWYFGNVVIDRDVFGGGDYGDYGVVICNRRIVVGVERATNGSKGVVGTTIVDDGQWHHVAFTRRFSDGQIRLFVDGNIEGTLSTSDANGNVSYRDGRTTSYPNSDPYLVFGAEKHDYPGSLYYRGWLDEVRISNNIRYTSAFTRPTTPFVTDANTMALYHFNEGSGNVLNDSSGISGGPSHGEIKYGGNPIGPQWSTDSPFYDSLLVTTTADAGPGSLRNAVAIAASNATISFASSLQNQTILLTSGTITINKHLQIINPYTQIVNIQVSGTGPVFQINTGFNLTLNKLGLIGGNGFNGRILHNAGNLTLQNVQCTDSFEGNGSAILNTGTITANGSNVLQK